MVIHRKDIQTHLSSNLKFLRSQKKATLKMMAEELGLSGKTSYLAYEAGKARPDIFKLLKLASYFDVSVEDLLNKDLTIQSNHKDLKEDNIKYELEVVPFAAAAGYAKGFGDNGYLKKLKRIKVNFKPYGIARAFKIKGDSMHPLIEDGSTVVGIKITPAEIKPNKQYIVVTDEGLQCKNIEVGENNFIYLISENKEYKIKHIEKSELRELWEVWKTVEA